MSNAPMMKSRCASCGRPSKKRLVGSDLSGDPDGDGFLEYDGNGYQGPRHGLRNQEWKDSFDAVFHCDGELAQGPTTLCEVQGYAYAAKRLAAQCARRRCHGVGSLLAL